MSRLCISLKIFRPWQAPTGPASQSGLKAHDHYYVTETARRQFIVVQKLPLGSSITIIGGQRRVAADRITPAE
jgi:hypothetical protein